LLLIQIAQQKETDPNSVGGGGFLDVLNLEIWESMTFDWFDGIYIVLQEALNRNCYGNVLVC
jgi:hypothetical protein